jgi:VanZ family protein
VSRSLRAWVPALLWAGLIFWLSSRSRLPSVPIPGIDKVEHAAAYAVLAWLAIRGLRAAVLDPAWGAVLASLFGVSDEIHQAFVAGRSSDVFDWVADTLGALAALYLYRRLRDRRARPVPNASAPAGAPEPAHD